MAIFYIHIIFIDAKFPYFNNYLLFFFLTKLNFFIGNILYARHYAIQE